MVNYEVMDDERYPNTLIVKLKGPLRENHDSEYLDLIEGNSDKNLVLDMEDASLVNTSGAGIIIESYRLLSDKGLNVALCNVSERAETLLGRMVGEVIKRFDSLQDALDSLD